MKFKHLFLGLVAACAAFVSCEKAEQIGAPAVSVNPTSITFEKGVLTQEVQLTATLDWTATAPDWITLSATSGKASAQPQKITLSIEGENKGNDKKGEIVFDIKMAKATLNVVWKGEQGEYIAEKGDGSKEKPYNITQAVEAVQDLTWTDKDNFEKVGPYYVKGKVVSIKSNFDNPTEKDGETIYYGNAEFVLSDDGTTNTPQFTCYRIKYYGNKAWQQGQTPVLNIGDVVVFYGELMYYGSGEGGKTRIPETVNNTAYLISINGTEGGGSDVDPSEYENAPASTIADFIAEGETGKIYKLTGTVSGSINATYGNFDLVDETGKIYIYGCKNWASYKDKVKLGATVVLGGAYKAYTDKSGNVKDEIVDAYILSCEGGEDPEESDPKGTGTLDDPYNAAMAKKVASALESGAKTESDVYVKGKIASIKYAFDEEHGTATFDISDNGSTTVTTFTCYSVFYLENKSWVEGYNQVAVGDEVIIYGKLTNYNGNTPETASKEAYIYSLNGETEAGGDIAVINITSFSNTSDGISAQWDAIDGADSYTWIVYHQDSSKEDGIDIDAFGYTEDASVESSASSHADDDQWFITSFTEGVVYYFGVVVYDSEYNVVATSAPKSFSVLPAGSSEVTWGTEQLAAAACGDVVNQMDDVISFTNSSDYGTTTVTQLRIYKGKTFTVSAADGAVITSIKITCTANGTTKQGPGCWGAGAPEGYTFDAEGPTGQWVGSASSVSFTATDNQVRIQELTVTYSK